MKIFKLKKLSIVLLFVLLASCAGNSGNPQSYISSIELKTKTPIAKGHARIFLQGGKTSVGVGRYDHSCEIEVNDVSDGTAYILPDKFTVTGVSHRRTSNELTGFSSPVFGSCSETTFHETHFKLFSAKQPDVRGMVCREGFNSCFGHFANKKQIQKTLGTNFVVK